jgi:hypothetical protein
LREAKPTTRESKEAHSKKAKGAKFGGSVFRKTHSNHFETLAKEVW